MVININQTKANIAKKFEIYFNNELRYYAEQSSLTSMHSNSLLNLDGSIVLKTIYILTANTEKMVFSVLAVASMVVIQLTIHNVALQVFSYIAMFSIYTIATRKMKSKACRIHDSYGNDIATFSFDSSALLDFCYTIRFQDMTFRLYTISKSTHQYIMVFLDNKQVAQIDKHLKVINNRDTYVLYLLDEHKSIADLLSMFVVYFDSFNYGNRGEVSIGVKYSWEWTYTKNNKLYDPSWIQTHFGTK